MTIFLRQDIAGQPTHRMSAYTLGLFEVVVKPALVCGVDVGLGRLLERLRFSGFSLAAATERGLNYCLLIGQAL